MRSATRVALRLAAVLIWLATGILLVLALIVLPHPWGLLTAPVVALAGTTTGVAILETGRPTHPQPPFTE